MPWSAMISSFSVGFWEKIHSFNVEQGRKCNHLRNKTTLFPLQRVLKLVGWKSESSAILVMLNEFYPHPEIPCCEKTEGKRFPKIKNQESHAWDFIEEDFYN